MNYYDLAKDILNYVGGEHNIASVTHCATRLRFNLKDDKKADINQIKNLHGVFGAVNKGGQFQVIIGNDVPSVYKELETMIHLDEKGKKEKKKFSISMIFDVIAGIFVPLIPAIAGCGLLKAVLSLCTTFGLLSTDSQNFYIISMVADTAFYFLPVLIAYTAAKKFNCSPFLAVVMGGILLHPNFAALVSAGEPVHFLGMPVTLVNYGSSVLPIILIVGVLAYVQKFFDKIMPKAVSLILVPLCTILVMIPVALVIVGPLGNILGNYLADGIMWLDSKVSWLVPMVVGAFTPLLVMTGMHYGLFPAVFTQLATQGFNTVCTGFFPSNMAQAAATLAVSIKAKNKETKQLALSAGITALMGITEPALYGVTMKLKRPLYAVMISGGLGGLYFGIMSVHAFTPLAGNPLQFAAYINAENSMNLVHMVIGVVIAMIASFTLTWVFGFEEEGVQEEIEDVKKTVENKEVLNKKIVLGSPVEGKCIPLSEVKDETFSSGIMGKGVAVEPKKGSIIAPCDGVITTLFHTYHAIGITSEEGVEILIHVGIDTVELEGEFFKPYIKTGDKIKKGDLLLTFDQDKIKEKGYDVITPIIITNSNNYLDIFETENSEVFAGEDLLTIL